MEWSPFLPAEDEAFDPKWWGAEEPTTVDLWLLEVVYETAAAEARCPKCASPLGRGIRVQAWPTLRGTQRWSVSVRTRCRGWRRHVYEARVTRSSRGVDLGPFEASLW